MKTSASKDRRNQDTSPKEVKTSGSTIVSSEKLLASKVRSKKTRHFSKEVKTSASKGKEVGKPRHSYTKEVRTRTEVIY